MAKWVFKTRKGRLIGPPSCGVRESYLRGVKHGRFNAYSG